MLLPYPISANRYWRNMRGRMIKSKEAQDFCNDVKEIAAYGKAKLINGDVAINVTLHPKTKKNGQASAVCCDLDNTLKVVIDALQGVAYANDKQIKSIFACVGEPIPNGGLTVQWREHAEVSQA